MTSKVTFAESTAASATKPSRPTRRRSKIPSQKVYGPRAYAIMLPWDKMAARLVAQNQELQQMLDANRIVAFQMKIDMQIACWCDDIAEAGIWPNAFGVLVDDRSQPTLLQVLGLADNTHPENQKLPTNDQIRQIRELLNLDSDEFPLKWYKDVYPEHHD